MNCYALANPISLLTGKPREEFSRDDLLGVIESQGIERVTFHYTGLDGKLKELRLPVTDRRQAERILSGGERVDGSSLFRGIVDAAVSDLYVVPVYRTAFLNPFDEKSLDLTCRYLTRTGELAPFAPDTILLKASRLFSERTGMALHALGELEFFLLSDAAASTYRSPRQRGYHASAPFLKSGAILDEMVRATAQITGAVKYAHSEVGYVESLRSDIDEIRGKQAEQLEIEFLPTPIDEMGDHLVLARWLIRNVAYRHGCVATFAPKLDEGVAGNGLHVHIELMRDGNSAMTDDAGGLSEEARRLIGGLCMHADSLTAFGNTVSAAYLRLVPNQEAPTTVCWSDLNRSAMIRVPLGWPGGGSLAGLVNPADAGAGTGTPRQTVELRTPDGSAIVHLLLAGIAMAAEKGLADPSSLAIAERAYVTGNIFQQKAQGGGLASLPRSCTASARLLLAKRALYERDGVFPPAVIDYAARLLQAEDDEEMNAALADMPADDRLHETRRIMHRDLHRH